MTNVKTLDLLLTNRLQLDDMVMGNLLNCSSYKIVISCTEKWEVSVVNTENVLH